MRFLVIGDIHGYTGALKALLDEVAPGAADKVIFLGDYVDKGPDVTGTLDLVSQLSQDRNWIFLRGNHDQMLIDARRDKAAFPIWECLSGESPLASYGVGSTEELLRRIPANHLHFLENRCCDHYETDTYIFVHGGIRPAVSPKEEDRERLHWTTLDAAEAHLSGRTVICGHSAQESGQIADLGHTICIDTGITKGGYLTCLDLSDLSYTQACAVGEIRKGKLRETNPS